MSENVTVLRKTAPNDEATVAKVLRSLRRDLMRSDTGIEPTERQIIEAAIRLCVKGGSRCGR
jgi:hypothetical protein